MKRPHVVYTDMVAERRELTLGISTWPNHEETHAEYTDCTTLGPELSRDRSAKKIRRSQEVIKTSRRTARRSPAGKVQICYKKA